MDSENALIRVSLPSLDVTDGPALLGRINEVAMELLQRQIPFCSPTPVKRYIDSDGTVMMISIQGKPVYGDPRPTRNPFTGFTIEVENAQGDTASVRVEMTVARK